MDNVARLAGVLGEIKVDWAVLTGADSVCFATGHVVGIEIGLNPFAGGPTLAFIGRDQSVGIVCANIEGEQIRGVNYETYRGFECAVTDVAANFHRAVLAMAKRLGVSGKCGIEARSHPATLNEILGGASVSIDHDLARLRAIKTPHEIEKMRFAALCVAAGQDEARKRSSVGASELDVLNRIRARMENMAGERCAFAGEYLSGVTHTATLGTQPSSRVLQKGDPIICDLGPRVHGYWGDSCGSFVVDATPSEAYFRMFQASREALDLAISEIRPGLKVSELDRLLRAFMQKQGYVYPHHSGHGIGTSVHEFPRIVPDEDALLEADMFLMVEPSAYDPEVGGVRCEYMLRVTSTGSEIVAPFELNPVLGA
ncbi:M24 family metallopeptidase [Falsihalocynthiibacter sp. S25ZX9]|uniref:M24 family metallopeptidase n=1 Tax=Falsihalocynthiibacter sp. S25ZX9 TaxID=3240870 RepID=UPI00350F0F8C